MGAPNAIAQSLPANDCWRLVGYKCELLHAWRASAMALPTGVKAFTPAHQPAE